ncbi:nose resistant to fluoxetine protein 6-like [Ornithodoros turicata]|uniref:nose resistant to fluoxetine protein 6-like n=1 Tax=Ornithodoros turicata TaxID=34597 RepID=UPI0031396372
MRLPLRAAFLTLLLVLFVRAQETSPVTPSSTGDVSASTPRTTTTTQDPGPDPRNPFKYYAKKQTQLIKGIMKNVMEHVAPQFMGDISRVNLTGDCAYGVFKYILGIKQLYPWAIKMLDSTGKAPDGVFYGSLTAFGDMDECLSVRATHRKYSGKIEKYFHGQYCAADVRPILPPKPPHYKPKTFLKNLTDEVPLYKNLLGDISVAYFYFAQIRLGLCMPSTCTRDDIQTLADTVAALAQMNVTIPWCEKEHPVRYTTFQLTAIGILAFFFSLVLLGTTLDVAPRILQSWSIVDPDIKPHKNERNWIIDVLLTFSAYTNGQRILSTESGTLAPLHGMRVITMGWIILGHTFFYKNYVLTGGLLEALEWGKSLPFQVVLNVFPAVETFVTISGILVAYTSLEKLEKSDGQLSLFIYYFHRYWRLTPAFILVSLLMILLPLTGSGPVWNETLQPYAQACERNWWTNPLYIGSWIRREDMCLPHGWYLSCDMHYYIIAPIIFFLLYRRPRIGFAILSVLGVLSIIVVAAITYAGNFPPIPLFVDPDPDHYNDFMSLIGYRPYTHLTAFCIGMATGYFLHKNRTLRMNRVTRLLGWLVAGGLNLIIVFGAYDWNANDAPSLGVAILYGAFSRTVWALGIAWIVVACTTGNGGFINTILSWKAFIPLSRLTFLVYLAHPLLILWHTAYLKKPYYTTQFFTGYLFIGHLFVSYCLSFSLTLTFESPFILLERIITSKLGLSHAATSTSPKTIDLNTVGDKQHSNGQANKGLDNV